MNKPAIPSEFISSCYVGIWLNAFLDGKESLERCFDALASELKVVELETNPMPLLDFFKWLKIKNLEKARVHLPVSGALDGLIDTGAYLDLALASGQAISLLGNENYVLVPTQASWRLFPIKLPPKLPVNYWKETESEFTNFILTVGNRIEAYDLVAKNDNSKELLIALDHNISYLEFPENQPQKVTELLGRLMRTLAIGLLAKEAWVPSASSSKNQLYIEKIEELITRSRSFLSQLANYAYSND